MTREEAIEVLKDWDGYFIGHSSDDVCEALSMAITALEQEPSSDAISRQAVLDWATTIETDDYSGNEILDVVLVEDIKSLPSVTQKSETVTEFADRCQECGAKYGKLWKQEPNTGQYEKHIDHTDCIWYGNDSGCPVTCSQYRDGWNDAMDYIFKNGKGYQPYRHDD